MNTVTQLRDMTMTAFAEGILGAINGATLLVVVVAAFLLVAEWLEEHP